MIRDYYNSYFNGIDIKSKISTMWWSGLTCTKLMHDTGLIDHFEYSLVSYVEITLLILITAKLIIPKNASVAIKLLVWKNNSFCNSVYWIYSFFTNYPLSSWNKITTKIQRWLISFRGLFWECLRDQISITCIKRDRTSLLNLMEHKQKTFFYLLGIWRYIAANC